MLKARLDGLINQKYQNIGGIVICKDNEIQYESYFNNCTKNTNFHIFSVTKSIMSLVIGIAIDKGAIGSINQKILDFFPEYEVKNEGAAINRVTIRDMLTMTVPYQYGLNPYPKFFTSEDWAKAAMDYIGKSKKIGKFQYAPLIGPDILSAILVRTTGQSVLDFATENLFKPLGIQEKETLIFQDKEEQLAFYKQGNINAWVADPKGLHTAGWGLSITTQDMNKVGRLIMNKGMWEGRQIISEQWISQMIAKQSVCKRWHLLYGYLWWIVDEEKPIYMAMGDGGNVIYVNEEKAMVISIASLFIRHPRNRIKLIQKEIEPFL